MDDQSPVDPPVDQIARQEALDWPLDVQRTDASGEIDLGQLEFNLSLTPRQRIEQNDAWVAFIHIARRAGLRLYAKQSSA